MPERNLNQEKLITEVENKDSGQTLRVYEMENGTKRFEGLLPNDDTGEHKIPNQNQALEDNTEKLSEGMKLRIEKDRKRAYEENSIRARIKQIKESLRRLI